MNEEINRAVVQRGYEAFGRGDIEALLALLSEDVRWVTPGPAEMPTAGRRQGHAEVAGFFQALDSIVIIDRFEPNTFIAEGDRVIVLGTESARVKATGKAIELEWAHAFTLSNGKVTAFNEYVDTAAVVAELKAAQAHT